MGKQTSQPSVQRQATLQTVGTTAKALLWQPTREPRSQTHCLREAASDER